LAVRRGDCPLKYSSRTRFPLWLIRRLCRRGIWLAACSASPNNESSIAIGSAAGDGVIQSSKLASRAVVTGAMRSFILKRDEPGSVIIDRIQDPAEFFPFGTDAFLSLAAIDGAGIRGAFWTNGFRPGVNLHWIFTGRAAANEQGGRENSCRANVYTHVHIEQSVGEKFHKKSPLRSKGLFFAERSGLLLNFNVLFNDTDLLAIAAAVDEGDFLVISGRDQH